MDGSVCMFTTMEPGQYTIDFSLHMNDKSSTDTDPVHGPVALTNDGNNDVTMIVGVINNLPVILL